jgi:hypothetical protein
MSIVLMGSTSGSITLAEPAVAGTNTISLPAATGNALVDVARSLTSNGYIKLSDGLIIQWGSGSASAATSGTSTSVTFPIAFPTNAYMVNVNLSNTITGGGQAGTSNTVVTALSTTGYTWVRGNNANQDSFRDYFWIAIGN